MASSVVFAGIAPHPPLLVPEVGRDRIQNVSDSQRSLREFSKRLVQSQPDTIVLISPHSPLDPNAFTVRWASELRGDFREFRAPSVEIVFPNDRKLIDAIARESAAGDINFKLLARDYPLDHGALVPLYYLREAGWNGPVVVVGFCFQSNEIHLAFGRAIERAASGIGRRIAMVASGDLSHRLIVGGPYEFEPTAHYFDREIVTAVSDGNSRAVLNVDEGLRERAGECGYRSIVIALGAVDERPTEPQVLSYEGPFGVGYMVAILIERARGGATAS